MVVSADLSNLISSGALTVSGPANQQELDRFIQYAAMFRSDGEAMCVALAEERFRQLTGSGFRAAALSGDGSPGKLLGKFDQEVERTLFIPHLQGG